MSTATAVSSAATDEDEGVEAAALEVVRRLVTKLETKHEEYATKAREFNDLVRQTRGEMDSAKATLRALERDAGLQPTPGNRPRRLNMPGNPHADANT